AARARLRRYPAGGIAAREREHIPDLWIVLAGHLVIRVGKGAEVRRAKEWFAGDVGGYLPYSRMTGSPGTLTAEEETEVLLVSSEHFPEMIRDCHELTARLVHEMVDRARYFRSGDLQK